MKMQFEKWTVIIFALCTSDIIMRRTINHSCDVIPFLQWHKMPAMHLRFSSCIPVLILKSQRLKFSQTNKFSQIIKFGVTNQYLDLHPLLCIGSASTGKMSRIRRYIEVKWITDFKLL